MKAWVVDTCVVLDIALNDAAHGIKSAQLLQSEEYAANHLYMNLYMKG